MRSPATQGALLLLFDIASDAVAEHDDWHTHEHMPERLGIAGFLRGTRWTRPAPAAAGPRYCVVYEVREAAVLDGPAYRRRLDNPTPWTAKIMSSYIGMRRTMCTIVAGEGGGIGGAGLVVSFAPAPGRAALVRDRLLAEVLPGLAGRRGLSSWRLLEQSLPAVMTREQAMRGADGAVDAALWVTGYDIEVLRSLAATDLGAARLRECGVMASESALFTLAHALTATGARTGTLRTSSTPPPQPE